VPSGGRESGGHGSAGELRDGDQDAAEGELDYIENVDVLSLAAHSGPPPRGYWRTVREVIRIKRERAAAEALVSLPANLVLAQNTETRGGTTSQNARAQTAHPLEQAVRAQFERAVAEAAPPRQSRCMPRTRMMA
jgi:hypothetical protein